MEFLHPEKRKKKNRRLLYGYGLLGVLVILATYILVATALGYEVLSTRGDVVQNGLMFVGSQPVRANVSVNGVRERERTEARLTLPAGEYQVALDEPGYVSWSKKIMLEGGQVAFVTYPRLIPVNLESERLSIMPANTGFTSQSPDSRWLIVQHNRALPAIEIFDLEKETPTPQAAVLPAKLRVSEKNAYGTYRPIEWSDNNRFLLLEQTLPSGRKIFLMLDRENIDASLNLNEHFKANPAAITFFDKKPDRVYMRFTEGGVLRRGVISTGQMEAPILNQVLSYVGYGDNVILYVTSRDATAGKVAVKIQEDSTSYSIAELPFHGSNYFLDIARYDGTWFFAAGSAADDRVYVYRNPLNFLKSGDRGEDSLLPPVAAVLRSGTPQALSFSSNGRFVSARGGQQMAVFDAQKNTVYRYELPFTADKNSQITWVDGFYMQGVSGGVLQLFEFDGQNVRTLKNVNNRVPGFFSNNHEKLFHIGPDPADSKINSLQITPLKIKN